MPVAQRPCKLIQPGKRHIILTHGTGFLTAGYSEIFLEIQDHKARRQAEAKFLLFGLKLCLGQHCCGPGHLDTLRSRLDVSNHLAQFTHNGAYELALILQGPFEFEVAPLQFVTRKAVP